MELYNETHKVIKAIRKRFNIYHEIPCTADDRRVQEIIGIVVRTIEALPSADVVPKSEYDELVGKFECFLCHATGSRLSKHTYDLRTMEPVATDCINETYNDGYGEGYKDCAREIFEEIEKYKRSPMPECKPVYVINDYSFAELKKKYAEEKT